MKFKFKIQKYQTEVVEDTVSVFNGQHKYEHTTYMRDMGTASCRFSFRSSISKSQNTKLRTCRSQ